MKKRNSGLTLIELLVVITILGVLIGILLSGLSYKRGADKAKVIDIAQWLTVVASAHREYVLDQGTQPNSIDDLINKGYLEFKKYDVNLETKTIEFSSNPEDGGSKDCKVWYLNKSFKDLGGKSFCEAFCSILKTKGVSGTYSCKYSPPCNDLNINPGIIVSCN